MKTINDYERLRSWYLARLRKLSLENVAVQGLTPASLIQADRENIEKIILKSQAKSNGEKSRKQLGVELLLHFVLVLILVSVYLPLPAYGFSLTHSADLAYLSIAFLFLIEPLFAFLRKNESSDPAQ